MGFVLCWVLSGLGMALLFEVKSLECGAGDRDSRVAGLMMVLFWMDARVVRDSWNLV